MLSSLNTSSREDQQEDDDGKQHLVPPPRQQQPPDPDQQQMHLHTILLHQQQQQQQQQQQMQQREQLHYLQYLLRSRPPAPPALLPQPACGFYLPLSSSSLPTEPASAAAVGSCSAATNTTRQLLINCAELVHRADFQEAHRALSLLSSTTSPHGDYANRLAHQFTQALSLRLTYLSLLRPAIPPVMTSSAAAAASTSSSSSPFGPDTVLRCGSSRSVQPSPCMSSSPSTTATSLPPPPPADSETLQSCYLSLNQITPFIRFCHLTANQAILEAVQGHRAVHILDLDTMHGVQWPPLMQAIAESAVDPEDTPSIRLTGAGTDLQMLQRTGHRLKTFADTLGLKFQFQPLLLTNDHHHHQGTGGAGLFAVSGPHAEEQLFERFYSSSSITTSTAPSTSCSTSSTDHKAFTMNTFRLHPGETLAVNCVLCLHKVLKEQKNQGTNTNHDIDSGLLAFLRRIKALNPKVVTVAEREASHNSPHFMHRFTEALDHYAALFDSLEATLPPGSRDRMAVEQAWFGKEIADVVASEGDGRRERHQRFERWEQIMRAAGFIAVPLSPFAFSQAKLLLRLHYPSEGYNLQMVRDTLFLGWKNTPLFSVSSWQ